MQTTCTSREKRKGERGAGEREAGRKVRKKNTGNEDDEAAATKKDEDIEATAVQRTRPSDRIDRRGWRRLSFKRGYPLID